MDSDQRKYFILSTCNLAEVKRRLVKANSNCKSKIYIYHLTDENSKPFVNGFSTTLGFKKNNEKLVYNILNKMPSGHIIPYIDKRAKREPNNKYYSDD